MQIISIVQAPHRVSTRPRLLLARASIVWLWPGIPLTERRGATIQPISPDAMRFWLSKFLGPEIVGQPVPTIVAQAAEYLTKGDETAAEICLHRVGSATLSPEGALLAAAVAVRLGISVGYVTHREEPAIRPAANEPISRSIRPFTETPHEPVSQSVSGRRCAANRACSATSSY